MDYTSFFNIVENYKQGSEMLSELHDIGFDFFEGKYQLSDILYKQLEYSIKAVYTEEGFDWVSWYIFERNFGLDDLEAFDENNDRICNTLEEIFLYITKYHKKPQL
jgi:hypothetical protein